MDKTGIFFQALISFNQSNLLIKELGEQQRLEEVMNQKL